MVNKNRL